MNNLVKAGEFVKRQIKGSKYSYFNGTFSELEELTYKHFENNLPGYREGVVKVLVFAYGFVSGVVALNADSVITTTFKARRPGEAAYLSSTATGMRIPAKHVEIICYHRDVILEDGDTPIAEWEIVSINASAVKDEPMISMVMVRNMAGLEGGTKAQYSAEQYMEAILYWSDKAMAA